MESKPSVYGYMQRLKDLWDKDHPNLNHLSKKHLREQAVRIKKKNLVQEADIVSHKQQDLTTEQQQQQDPTTEKQQQQDWTGNNNTDEIRTPKRPGPGLTMRSMKMTNSH